MEKENIKDMFNLQIKIMEQVKVPSNIDNWVIPLVSPQAIKTHEDNGLTIQHLICTNLDEHLYEFLKKLNYYPAVVHPELQFDRVICEKLNEVYQLDFLKPEYNDYLYFTVEDLKRGDKQWREQFGCSHFFFTGALLHAEFYRNEGYVEYRLLVCFKRPETIITPEQNFLSSVIS